MPEDQSRDIGRLQASVEGLKGDMVNLRDDIRRLFDKLEDQGKEITKMSSQRGEIIKIMRAFMEDSKDQRKFTDDTRREMDIAEERLERMEREGCSNRCNDDDPTVGAFAKRIALKALEWVAVVGAIGLLVSVMQGTTEAISTKAKAHKTTPSK